MSRWIEASQQFFYLSQLWRLSLFQRAQNTMSRHIDRHPAPQFHPANFYVSTAFRLFDTEHTNTSFIWSTFEQIPDGFLQSAAINYAFYQI